MQIRHLDLDIDPYSDSALLSKHYEDLGRVLRSMAGLVGLRLSTGHTTRSVSDAVDARIHATPGELEDLFGNFTWTQLRCLELRALHATESTMTSFLQRHASTLKHLSLDSMWLRGDRSQWEAPLNIMKDEMRLEYLQVDGVWGCDTLDDGAPDDDTLDDDDRLGAVVYSMDMEWASELCEAIVGNCEGSVGDLIPEDAKDVIMELMWN